MAATAARIALTLNDGVVLSKVDTTIKAAHPGADDAGQEIELFFDSSADAQVILDERWNWRSTAGRVKEQVEFDSSYNLGTSVALTPAVPRFTVQDEDRGIYNASCAVRAYSVDYNTERYAVELTA